MKKFSSTIIWIFVFTFILLVNNISIARMDKLSNQYLDQTYARGLSKLTDEELDKVSGQAGFANITRSTEGLKHVINIDLAMDIELYAEIDKLKFGYYTYSGQTGANLIWPIGWAFGNDDGEYNSDWDVDFEQVQLGESPNDTLKMSGIKLRLDFEEQAEGKVLNRLIVGSDNVQGRLYIQRAKSFTGLMNTSLAYDSNVIVEWMPPVWTRRTYVLNGEQHGGWEAVAAPLMGNVGKKGMHFYGEGFHIVMDKDNGIGVFAGFPMSYIDSDAMDWGK